MKVLDPWGDSENDTNDIVAVYFKQEANLPYLRVDFLDMRPDSPLYLYLALDFKPGGSNALINGGSAASDASWDLLLSSSAGGKQSALDSTYVQHPDYITRATFDTELDYIQFDLSSAALSGWDGKPFKLQALVTDTTATRIIDETAVALTGDTTGTGKLVPLFGNMFAGYGPHAVSWYDGYAFSPADRPDERVGLKYFLDALEKYEVPVTCIDMRLDVLTANEYLGIADRIRTMAKRGLFDLLPTLTYGYFMPWQPADVDAVAMKMAQQIWQDLGLPQGKVFYPYESMLTAGDLEEIKTQGYPAVYANDRYGYWFGWINDWGNPQEVTDWNRLSRKIQKENGILILPGMQGYAWDARWEKTGVEPGWFLLRYDSFQGTDGGLHHGWRRVLLDMAIDPDQEQYITMGTDLNLTSWQLPGEAERSLRWIASHPWIETTTLDSLLGRGWKPVDRGNVSLAPDQPLEQYPMQDDQHYNTYFWDFYYGGVSDGHSPLIPKGTKIEGYADYVPYLRNGQRIPSGMKMGDSKTPGTIVYETLRNLKAAPDNKISSLAWYAYFLNIAEQTFHAQSMYSGGEAPKGDWGGAYLDPNAKVRAGMVRQVNKMVAAARWADEAAHGTLSDRTEVTAVDLDLDGENEYVLKNNRVFAIFENDGGTLEYAFAYDPASGPVQLVAPTYELSLMSARNYEEAEALPTFPPIENAFDDGEAYRSAVFATNVSGSGLEFVSPDGKLRKSFTLEGNTLSAHYNIGGQSEILVNFALAINPLSMFQQNWWEKITRVDSPESTGWSNADGGYAAINAPQAARVSADSFLDSPARSDGHESKDPPYTTGHWLLFPYHTVTVKGTGEFDIDLVLAAAPPAASKAPVQTPAPQSTSQASPTTQPSSKPDTGGPGPLIMLVGILLLLGIGVMVTLRLRGKRG